MFKIITSIVHCAEIEKYGCTIVIDLNEEPVAISGQRLARALDLRQPENLELTKSLAHVDGALHIGADSKLHGFACLLDGRAIPGEDRSRGARYNSALRFTAEHDNIIVVVVSSDRPVSIILEGVEQSAKCEWKPVYNYIARPLTTTCFKLQVILYPIPYRIYFRPIYIESLFYPGIQFLICHSITKNTLPFPRWNTIVIKFSLFLKKGQTIQVIECL